MRGYLRLGEVFCESVDYNCALGNLNKAESNFHEMGMKFDLALTCSVYADLFKQKGKKTKAIEYLEKVIDIMNEREATGWVNKFAVELAALS